MFMLVPSTSLFTSKAVLAPLSYCGLVCLQVLIKTLIQVKYKQHLREVLLYSNHLFTHYIYFKNVHVIL